MAEETPSQLFQQKGEILKNHILISSRNLFSSSGSNRNVSFLTLPHPRYGLIQYIQINSHDIYEFQIISPRKYGSWFIDQRICSDSSYYLLSKYDIRYILLPYFIQSANKFSPLLQILSSQSSSSSTSAPNDLQKIDFSNFHEWKLEEICDVNDKLGDDMLLYRLNNEKLLTWLQQKIIKLQQIIYQKRRNNEIQATKSLFDSSFQSKNHHGDSSLSSDHSVPTEEDLKTSLIILLDYLPESVSEQLLQSYNMTIDSLLSSSSSSSNGSNHGINKRKADWEAALEIEKQTLTFTTTGLKSSNQTLDNQQSTPKSSSTAPSSASKVNSKLLKAGKGTQSITSFFAKKSS